MGDGSSESHDEEHFSQPETAEIAEIKRERAKKKKEET